MGHDRDDRIRKRAHELWELEGRPHGKEREHWEQAERELGGSDQPAAAGSTAKKAVKSAGKPAAAGKAGGAKKSPADKPAAKSPAGKAPGKKA